MRLFNHIGVIIKSVALLCALLLCACRKDAIISETPAQEQASDLVRFDIKASNVWEPDIIGDDAPQAKSSSTRSAALLMDCEDEGAPLEDIFVYMVEEDYPAEEVVYADTKATSPEALYGIFARYSEAEDMSDASMFMNNLPFYSDGTYKDQDSYFWPGKGYLKFYAYAPYNEADSYIQFDKDGNPYIACTVWGDRDMMAGASQVVANYSTDAVQIQLNHLLSKIQIKAGSIPKGEIVGISIKKMLFSAFCAFFQKSITQNVTIFHILECVKWTNKN